MMRLDKMLSRQLGISRNDVSKIIRKGAVTVGGQVIKDAALKVSDQHFVCIDGRPVELQLKKRYFMLNKPKGYVCSTQDPEHLTVLHLLEEPNREALHTAGRLDLDSVGLVLLTDDGKWSHQITSPKHYCEKVYFVTVADPLSESLVEIFANGLLLKNEKTLTKPAKLSIVDDFHASVTISEGRYHQVRRMFAAAGNHVTELERRKIGKIELNVDLGEYRSLTDEEIASFAVLKDDPDDRKK